eukprot:scaffold79990_cov70-Phaeocystis_antarctica.AAC.2
MHPSVDYIYYMLVVVSAADHCIYASTPPGAAPRCRGGLRCVGHAQRPAGGGAALGVITSQHERHARPPGGPLGPSRARTTSLGRSVEAEADGGTAARSSGEAEVEVEVEEGAEVAACSWLQGGPRISPATWPHTLWRMHARRRKATHTSAAPRANAPCAISAGRTDAAERCRSLACSRLPISNLSRCQLTVARRAGYDPRAEKGARRRRPPALGK